MDLSRAELERLQRIVVGDTRFVRLGLRKEGGFVGDHVRCIGEPIPEHISARADDLPSLIEGVVAFDGLAHRGSLDPVVAAASIAFGFVYVHPFSDGNDRLHRWLIHHVLARGGFNPRGVIIGLAVVELQTCSSKSVSGEGRDGARDLPKSGNHAGPGPVSALQGVAFQCARFPTCEPTLQLHRLKTLLFGAVPSDENSLTIKKTAVPFLIAVCDKLTHGELTGVVIDVLAFYPSINMTSALERTLRCGHVGNRLPSFDFHIWHPKALVTFESLNRGTAVL